MAKKKPTPPPVEQAPKALVARKRRNITSRKSGIRSIAPQDKDPAFMSSEDMERRERFAQAYVAYGSITKAAETAGYGGTTASMRKSGSRLIQEPWVRDRIEQINTDLMDELKITQRGVLAELSRIGFADIGEITDPETHQIRPLRLIPKRTKAAISSYKTTTKTYGEGDEVVQSVESEVKFESKSNALEKLGRHAGLWPRDEGDRNGINPEDFARALGEGIARVINGRRTIEHDSQ